MGTLIEKINQILAEWDPIGVGTTLATYEYRGYIPLILKSINDEKSLMDCLTNILVNDIGLDYDFSNEFHIKDLRHVCERIIQVYKMYQ